MVSSNQRSLHQQVIRQSIPIAVGVLIVLIIMLLVVSFERVTNEVENAQRATLIIQASVLQRAIDELTNDVTLLSRTDEALHFGELLLETDTQRTDEFNQAQRRLTQGFLTIINQTSYARVRFLTTAGQVYTQVELNNNIPFSDLLLQTTPISDSLHWQRSRDNLQTVIAPISPHSSLSGRRLWIRAFAPVTDSANENRFLGTIELALDVTALVQPTQPEGARWLIINRDNQVVNLLNDLPQPLAEVDPLLVDSYVNLSADYHDGQIASSVSVDLSYVEDAPWTLVLLEPGAPIILGWVVRAVLAIIVITTIVGLACYLFYRILQARLTPLTTTSEMAVKLAMGEMTDTLPIIPSTDEIGQLNDAFKRISHRVNELSAELGENVQQNQQQLETALRISHEINASQHINNLFDRAIEQVCREFNLYQAQAFLVDDVALNLVLHYSYGEHAAHLIEQRPQILIGSPTLIGSVAASGDVIFVDNTRRGSSYQPDLQLPQTASRIALPLLVEGHVIGVLDLHSKIARHFKANEIAILRLLAGHIAMAVHKAKLISDFEVRLADDTRVSQPSTQKMADALSDSLGQENGYRYDLSNVQAFSDVVDDESIAAFSAPISIRGQVIGTITAAAPEGLSFAEGDHAILRAVADRVGLAVESARLFQETQSSLATTSALYELSRQLSEANGLDQVVRAVLNTFVPQARSGQIWLSDDDRTLRLAGHWDQEIESGERAEDVRFSTERVALLRDMSDQKLKLIQDVALDNRLDATLRELLQGFGAAAAVFIPFGGRGQSHGQFGLLFDAPRQFSEAEGRLYNTLIDQVMVAIDNRLLTQRTEMTLRQIESLYAASRLINTAETPQQLIMALMAASEQPYEFEIGLLEGKLDVEGLPTQVHIMAGTEGGGVAERDLVLPLTDKLNALPALPGVPVEDGFRMPFPLYSGNQPLAVLFIFSTVDHPLHLADYDVYQTLASQISTVLQNQRLLLQTSQALDETRRLYTASRDIASAQDSGSVYAATGDHLAQAEAAVSRISIFLAGPKPEATAAHYDVAYTWERTPRSDSPLRIGDQFTSQVAPFGALMGGKPDPLYFDSLGVQVSVLNRLPLLLGSWGARSAVIAPLRTQRAWFGVLICESGEEKAFTEAYIRFVRAIADQVATAVENRFLFDEAQTEAQRALALAEAGQFAAQIGSDFERNISQVFERVAQPASYDRWLLALIDEKDANRLQAVTMRTPALEEDVGNFAFDLLSTSHSIVDCVRLNRLLVINDPGRYPAFSDTPAALLADVGKHITVPVYSGSNIIGALMIGRDLRAADLDERDEQLVRTLAAQVAVAVENRRLFEAAERERQNLRSILETVPTGIVVLDARTLVPIQANQQSEELLGKPIDHTRPFNVADYNLIRTGTNVHYPEDELPITLVQRGRDSAFSDDVAAVRDENDQTDLLLNAAPIYDGRGNVTAIVAAFQNISNLRGLENTLQNSLREQIALYEATRSLSEASNVDEALDAALAQLMMLEPMDAYILLLDEQSGNLQVARGLLSPDTFNLPSEIFQSNPLLVSNIEDSYAIDDTVRAAIAALGAQAFASVPMRTREVIQGWLAVLYDHPLAPGADNERFLTTLADNAGIAIDNRNLQRRTELAFQEASVLYETNRALTSVNTPDEIVNAVVNHMKGDHIIQVFMAVPTDQTEGADMVVLANWQLDPVNGINLMGVTLNAEQFPAWRQVNAQQLLLIDNVALDEGLDEIERMGLESTDTQSLAVLPLRAGKRRLGVLWLASNQPYQHTEQDRRIYQSFAEQASLSMEASRLLEQTERRARQLSTSAQVSQFASSILEIDALLPRLVDLIRDSFRYDHVQIFLLDEEDKFAVLRASTGEAGRQLLSINHRLAKGSKSVIGQVTAVGEPVIALDTADARVVHRPNPYLPLTRSEMALPLVVKGKVVGALDVQSNIPNAFGDEDVQVLTTLSNQISVALDNARLFAQAETRAQEMGFLFSVTTAASAPDRSLHESLQGVAEIIRLQTEALDVAIYLSEKIIDQYDQEYTLLRPTALAGSDQPISELSDVLVGHDDNVLCDILDNWQTLIIDNVEEERRYIPIVAGARSVIAAPMLATNQVIGIIVVEDNRPGVYDNQTINLMGALTNSLSAIVESNRLLEQVQRSNEQLRELDKLKSDFLANMSHELRTPLNSIIGFSRVMLKGIDGPLTEMQEQDLQTIYNSGSHLLGLINDILDQAKMNAGKMDLHKDYFDIKPVVEGVRSIGIGLIKDKPIDMKLEIASGLPKAFGDEFRTRQVLLNLVSNASKFTQQGGIVLRVYVDKQSSNGKDMMRVDVQDSGIGIAEQDIHLLFEAFRQVDSSLTRTVGGTGLGLPIAKSLIEMQGGKMLVSSVVNEGSTFSILLPLEPTEAMEPDAPQASAPEEKPVSNKRSTTMVTITRKAEPNSENNADDTAVMAQKSADRPRIDKRRTTSAMRVVPVNRTLLLIEDNPDMVDQMRRALQREGYDIFAASIPLEAEAMASGLRPALIIMDADFAKGASWDILKRLQDREDTADIPVIMVALEDVQNRARETGAFSFLQRPFMPEQVVEMVRKAQIVSQTERILIIDDHDDSRRMLQQVISASGHYRVFTARSGMEGISLVARRRPDLVILDLRMPEMDGFAVLNELQANPETAQIPIMIVTADTLNTAEQDRLSSLQVVYKADLTQDNYQQFIQGVREHFDQA